MRRKGLRVERWRRGCGVRRPKGGKVKTYHGARFPSAVPGDPGRAEVWVEHGDGKKRPLPMQLRLWSHSPDGFEWGYCGSGPAQLALALLADVLRDDERASRLHQRFKRRVIARLPRESGWMLSAEAILGLVRYLDGEDGQRPEDCEEGE